MARSRERRLQTEKAPVGVCVCLGGFPFLQGFNRTGSASGLRDSSCLSSEQVTQSPPKVSVSGRISRRAYTGAKGLESAGRREEREWIKEPE